MVCTFVEVLRITNTAMKPLYLFFTSFPCKPDSQNQVPIILLPVTKKANLILGLPPCMEVDD